MRWWHAAIVAGILFSVGVAHADSIFWPSYNDTPGPGGLATVVLDYPRHGSRVKGPDLFIRLRSDNPKAAVRVKLDRRYIDLNGKPHTAPPSNPHDSPQWSFRDATGPELKIPVRGVAPGLHSLEIIRGAFGTELPDTNEQRITFIVE
ncbi:MAG TPA: hypothetical protein VGK74_13205 [Symbiobacteriaceae bacterium]